MALLKVEADKLTNESLVRGVVEVLITRGNRDLFSLLPFRRFEGSAYAFNQEATLPSGSSARDPYGTTIPGGVGTRLRQAIDVGMLARDADTALIDIVGKSDFNNQRSNDIQMAAKKLAQDFSFQFVNGRSDLGVTYADFNLRGLEHWLATYLASFPDQVIFATNDGLSNGTKQSLSLTKIDDLLSRWKGQGFDAIKSDRATAVAFKGLLNLAGGNTGALFMIDQFGQPVMQYSGVRWYISDDVGAEKVSGAAGEITSGAATLVVDDVKDPFWIGFSDLDVGRGIDVTTASIPANTTVLSVTDIRTVVLSANAGGTATVGVVTVSATEAIYAVRFDEMDGMSAIYHSGRGVPVGSIGEHHGPIAGFDSEDIGLLESGRIVRMALHWFGNFVLHSPFATARLSHFTV